MDGRKRHKKGMMMIGGGRSLVLVLVLVLGLEDFLLGEECAERKGREWRDK